MNQITHPSVQRATAELKIGKGGLTVSAELTPAGLLAIGALVSSILLATAVLVRTAKAPGASRNVRPN